MGGLPAVLLLCSFHGTARQTEHTNHLVSLHSSRRVFVFVFFLHCETLPSCGFCSTALAAVAQDQQAGNVSLLLAVSQ